MELIKKEKREVDVRQGYICDLCGVHMKNDYSTLFACSVVKTEGGRVLNTNHNDGHVSWDLQEEEVMEQAHFCCDCYIKITNFILQEGGKINEIR